MHRGHFSKRPSAGHSGSRPSHGRFQRSGSSYGRPAHARPHGGGRPHSGSGRRGPKPQNIDVSRFVNKAVITEDAPHFVPEHSFADFHVDQRLKVNIIARGYETPTPIQDRAIPHVLRGFDVVGIANTGTGKTAAFLIPLIDKMLRNPKENVLVIVPTRELATQIEEEFRAFAKGLTLFSIICIGGTNIGRQIRDLRHNYRVVIGTPGRLKDLAERRAISLAKFTTVVLDEADRMLDMGFIHDIKHLLAFLPPMRHTLFFSATLSREIGALISQFLREPITISVKTAETATSVEQDIVRVGGKDKLSVLHDLLIQPGYEKVLIFGRTKHGVEKLSKLLAARGFKAASIHGNKTQSHRQKALDLFKKSHVQVLVATDVAARGIDVSGVSHVINYDIPSTYEDYVHRIGRTGRAGKKGKALTFVD